MRADDHPAEFCQEMMLEAPTAGGLLAAGAHEDARRVLSYLQKTQLPGGHWPQNMWLDGSPYWNGIQMDETALPILLVDLARREKALAKGDVTQLWPLVKKAAAYLARSGPVTPQDRWEEDPGYTPFTVAAEIAALLAAAELADLNHEVSVATHLREIADGYDRRRPSAPIPSMVFPAVCVRRLYVTHRGHHVSSATSGAISCGRCPVPSGAKLRTSRRCTSAVTSRNGGSPRRTIHATATLMNRQQQHEGNHDPQRRSACQTFEDPK